MQYAYAFVISVSYKNNKCYKTMDFKITILYYYFRALSINKRLVWKK